MISKNYCVEFPSIYWPTHVIRVLYSANIDKKISYKKMKIFFLKFWIASKKIETIWMISNNEQETLEKFQK